MGRVLPFLHFTDVVVCVLISQLFSIHILKTPGGRIFIGSSTISLTVTLINSASQLLIDDPIYLTLHLKASAPVLPIPIHFFLDSTGIICSVSAKRNTQFSINLCSSMCRLSVQKHSLGFCECCQLKCAGKNEVAMNG